MDLVVNYGIGIRKANGDESNGPRLGERTLFP